MTERESLIDDRDTVPVCGFCHWTFDSHAPGCAQCKSGRYALSRREWRLDHGLESDSYLDKRLADIFGYDGRAEPPWEKSRG